MFKNYIKIAWRNLKKNRVYSLINIFGLAIGMTAALFIFIWVKNEFSSGYLHGCHTVKAAVANPAVSYQF